MKITSDFYEALGLGEERWRATEEDIKSAYKKLTLEYHPDKTGNDSCENRDFKTIQQAYKPCRILKRGELMIALTRCELSMPIFWVLFAFSLEDLGTVHRAPLPPSPRVDRRVRLFRLHNLPPGEMPIIVLHHPGRGEEASERFPAGEGRVLRYIQGNIPAPRPMERLAREAAFTR